MVLRDHRVIIIHSSLIKPDIKKGSQWIFKSCSLIKDRIRSITVWPMDRRKRGGRKILLFSTKKGKVSVKWNNMLRFLRNLGRGRKGILGKRGRRKQIILMIWSTWESRWRKLLKKLPFSPNRKGRNQLRDQLEINLSTQTQKILKTTVKVRSYLPNPKN